MTAQYLGQTQTQKTILSQKLQQSLYCLQLPAQELYAYLNEQALSNPLLEVHEPEQTAGSSAPISVGEQYEPWLSRKKDGEYSEDSYGQTEETFTDYLLAQLGQMKLLDTDKAHYLRCRYVVECLSSSGYLELDLFALAKSYGCSLFEMEQALYTVQQLDPIGVGARTLSECLKLQLAQSTHFNELNLRLIDHGLPLIAKGDYKTLAKLFDTTVSDISQSAEIIRSLNPIPSSGFSSKSRGEYVIPEAIITVLDGALSVELNRRALPRVNLQYDYCSMIDAKEHPEAQQYLQERMKAAKNVIEEVEDRNATLLRVIIKIVEIQQAYFTQHAPLVPLTMSQLGEILQLSTSTISRTVKDKYILFEHRAIPLKSFFSTALSSNEDNSTSVDAIKQQIRLIISYEDVHKPLSDDIICTRLIAQGVNISRRTVAKYRTEMGIPAKKDRKIK